jgi:hypothetical protein
MVQSFADLPAQLLRYRLASGPASAVRFERILAPEYSPAYAAGDQKSATRRRASSDKFVPFAGKAHAIPSAFDLPPAIFACSRPPCRKSFAIRRGARCTHRSSESNLPRLDASFSDLCASHSFLDPRSLRGVDEFCTRKSGFPAVVSQPTFFA